MYKNKEFTMDTKTNEKFYGLFLEDFRRNHVRNDDVDLIPHHEIEIDGS